MKWYQVFILAAIEFWISTATEIFYVLPDNSTNVSCPSQPCATLSQYLLDNGTLPVVLNVKYHFLPGEHHVPANMVLQYLNNFSIVGTVCKSSPPVVLVGSSQLYVIKINKSSNVTITNVMFKQFHQSQFKYHEQLTNLLIDVCYSCTIENVTFMNLGLIGRNIIGNSHFTEIIIKLYREKQNLQVFCQGITLMFWNQQLYTDHSHKNHLIMNHINISGEGTGKECYNRDPTGIHVLIIGNIENLIIIINNSLFYKLDHSALAVENRLSYSNRIIIENCTFEMNTFVAQDFQFTLRPLVNIMLSHISKLILFKNCYFKRNHLDQFLVSIIVRSHRAHVYGCRDCIGPGTNISFEGCQFKKNVGGLIEITNGHHYVNLLINIGSSQFPVLTQL